MRSRRYTPGAPLSPFVRCFWYSEGVPQAHSRERLLPNGEASIIFNLREDRIRSYDPNDLQRHVSFGPAVLSGPRSDYFVIDTSSQERVLGIQFRAGGASPFFRMPASEAKGNFVELDDLWAGAGSDIREQLVASCSVEQMFGKLERSLLERAARPLELHPAVAYAVKEFQRPGYGGTLAEVIDSIGLSSRRFIELFRRQVGLTPKVFCRVRRFQQVLETVHQRGDADWAQIALECGYYDHSHFIHDFKSFAGLTPGEYLAAATPHLNHVPLI